MLPWYSRHGLGRSRDSEELLAKVIWRSDWTQSKVDAEYISNSMKKLEPQSLLLLILLQIPRLIPAISLEKVTEDL